MARNRLVVKSLNDELIFFRKLSLQDKFMEVTARRRVIRRRLRRIRELGLNKFVSDPYIDNENLSLIVIDFRRQTLLKVDDINGMVESEFKKVVLIGNNKSTYIEELKIIIVKEVGKRIISMKRVENDNY